MGMVPVATTCVAGHCRVGIAAAGRSPNRCKRVIGRNFSAGFIDVVNVSDTLPDYVVRATIEAGFLVLVVGRNISVGALAQNLHLLPLHV